MRVKTTIRGTKSVLDILKVTDHRAMAKSSTNKAGGKAFIQTRRAVKKRYNVKAKIGELPFKKLKATAANLTYAIESPTRMYNIGVLFKGAKQTKSGVKAQIVKGRKTLIQGAFIARPSGKDYKAQGQKKTVTSNNDLVLKRKGVGAYPLGGIGDTRPKGIGWATMLLNSHTKKVTGDTFREQYELAFAALLTKRINKKVLG